MGAFHGFVDAHHSQSQKAGERPAVKMRNARGLDSPFGILLRAAPGKIRSEKSFHAARGANKGVNYLYADGHIKNLLAIEGTIQK